MVHVLGDRKRQKKTEEAGFLFSGLNRGPLAFFVIARDPVRLVTLMPVTVLEKASWVIAVASLVAMNRTASVMLLPAGVDALLGVFFIIAYVRLSRYVH